MRCQNGDYVVGVDEAGRGSLVGEMIVAGYAIHVKDLHKLEDIGVRDSKELIPAARRSIYKSLVTLGVFSVYPVSSEKIDTRNLSTLTEDAIYHVLHRITARIEGECIKSVTIDRYGTPRRIHSLLESIGVRAKPRIEEKADSQYLEVAAASIIAKHIRDTRIGVIRDLYGLKGSGYPSDPRTVEWVMDVLEKGLTPPVIRYSWGTLRGTRFYKQKRRRASLEDFM